MDLVRLLGCAIGLFSTILVLHFVLYYYPLPFYNERYSGPMRSFVETELKDSRKHAQRFRSGFRQGKVPIAERLHKEQRKRILGKEIPTDVSLYAPMHRGRANIEGTESKQRDKIDRLDEAQTIDYNHLNQAQHQDSESRKQILNANSLHKVQRPDDSRFDRLQMLEDRLKLVRRPDDRSRDLEMQDLLNVIKEKSSDPNQLQETNNREPENLLGTKIPDVEKLLGIKPLSDEQFQKLKTLYEKVSRGPNLHTPILDPAQKQLLEQAINKLYNEIHNPETDGLNVEKEEQLAKNFEATNLQQQKDRLEAKDWEAMHDRLMAVRKDRLDSMPDKPLLFEYGKQLPIVETPNIPSRPVPEESYHGTEHMLGR